MVRAGSGATTVRRAYVVLALQRMLGHASAKMTLDTYAELFDDDLDNVSALRRP